MKMRSAILCLGLLALVGACAASLEATQVVEQEKSLELDHAGASLFYSQVLLTILIPKFTR